MKRFITSILLFFSIIWADRPITAEDIVNMRYSAQPAMDVNGTQIAYVKIIPRRANEKRGGSYREIWVMNSDGSNKRKFTSSPINSWSPQWTPNGNLSFLSRRKEHHSAIQVYVISNDGGEATILTNHKTGIGSYQWSPNGKWIAFLSKDEKSNEKKKLEKDESSFLEECKKLISDGKKPDELKKKYSKDLIKKSALLSLKPRIIVCNVDEKSLPDGNKHSKACKKKFSDENIIIVCADIEDQIMGLQSNDRKDFMLESGIKSTGLDNLIKTGYNALGLSTFFTSGPEESRAWTIEKNSKAVDAAGVIHSDFKKKFIRAETVTHEDFIKYKGFNECKNAGKLRLEGKDYLVNDGDVMYFRVGS